MIDKVKKRDGRIINFNSEKITRAIFLAASEVASKENKTADYNTASQLTDQVEKHLNQKYAGTIPTVENIQDSVIKILIESGHAKTSETYILYRAERSRIRDSKSRLMKTIEDITFLDADKSDIKRENANIDGNTAMGSMLQYGSAVSKEFCKNFVIKSNHSGAHENGDIHIHDMDFLNMGTLTCCQIDIKKVFKNGFSTGHGFLREPQDIMSYAALAAIAIQSNQNDQHGGQSVASFDHDMANGVRKTFKKLYAENFYKALRLLAGESLQRESVIKNIISICDSCNSNHISRNDEEMKWEAEKLSEEYRIELSEIYKIQQFVYEETLIETNKKTYQAMEAFIHNLNTMHSRAGAQVPFSSINFGTDISEEGRMVSKNLMLSQEKGLGNGETPIFPILIFKIKEGINFDPQDPNYDLFKLAMRVSSKRLFPNFSFIDAPFNLPFYVEGRPETEAVYMGCRTRVMSNVAGDEQVLGRGNLSFTSINLPRLGIKHGISLGQRQTADLDGFFTELDEIIELVSEQLLERFEVQASKKVKNFPFLMGQGVWAGSEKLGWNDSVKDVIKEGTLTLGFIGLAECLIGLCGQHHGEDEYSRQLGFSIIEHIRKRMDEKSEEYKLNFSLIATPAEGLSGRFTRIDRKQYGVIKNITDKDYYTNSFHVPVGYDLNAFEKIQIEAPYHNLTNAGHISYIELDGNPGANLEAFETIIRAMKDAGMGYGSINHPLDRDPVCGYNGVIEDVCPGCERSEGDIPFERIRRITGYLVGTLDRFNDAKKSEVKDRIRHL